MAKKRDSDLPMNKVRNLEASPHVLKPQQERSREALGKIVSAAESLIRQKGIYSFAITKVAEIAKIPVGNIYRRFKGKDELLLAIKAEMVSRVSDVVAQRILNEFPSTLTEFIQNFVDATIKSVTFDEEMYRELLKWKPDSKAFLKFEAVGHVKVYKLYRDALLGFLPNLTQSQIDLVAPISFNLVVLPIVEKIRGDNPTLAALSWKEIGKEYTKASLEYLNASRGDRSKR